MKAIGYTPPRSIARIGALIDIDIDKTTASGHDILVKVAAISVNPVDTKVRANRKAVGGTPSFPVGTPLARWSRQAIRSRGLGPATRSGTRAR